MNSNIGDRLVKFMYKFKAVLDLHGYETVRLLIYYLPATSSLNLGLNENLGAVLAGIVIEVPS